jgi:hypothetical protein
MPQYYYVILESLWLNSGYRLQPKFNTNNIIHKLVYQWQMFTQLAPLIPNLSSDSRSTNCSNVSSTLQYWKVWLPQNVQIKSILQCQSNKVGVIHILQMSCEVTDVTASWKYIWKVDKNSTISLFRCKLASIRYIQIISYHTLIISAKFRPYRTGRYGGVSFRRFHSNLHFILETLPWADVFFWIQLHLPITLSIINKSYVAHFQ